MTLDGGKSGVAPRRDPSAQPNRLAVPTCAGCGAMSSPGACETGCAELKLLLVRAATVDALTSAEAEIQASIAALRPVADELMAGAAPAEGWEARYQALRERAREALSDPLDARVAAYVLEEPAAPAVTWWCNRCDRVDAPQPCLGICVWRVVEWARYDIYAELRRRVISAYETERQLRGLMLRIAHTSPRTGQHALTWTAFASRAEDVLGSVR